MTVAKKEELERNTKQCEDRLVRADKLIGGLAGEKGIDAITPLSDSHIFPDNCFFYLLNKNKLTSSRLKFKKLLQVFKVISKTHLSFFPFQS